MRTTFYKYKRSEIERVRGPAALCRLCSFFCAMYLAVLGQVFPALMLMGYRLIDETFQWLNPPDIIEDE